MEDQKYIVFSKINEDYLVDVTSQLRTSTEYDKVAEEVTKEDLLAIPGMPIYRRRHKKDPFLMNMPIHELNALGWVINVDLDCFEWVNPLVKLEPID